MKISTGIIVCLMVSLFACKKSDKNLQESNFDPFATYIQAVSSGIISKTDPIQIRINSEAKGVEVGDEIPASAFSISPSVKGRAFWKTKSIAVFEPEKHLESNTTYQMSFDAAKYIDIPADLGDFKFNVKTMPLSLSLEFSNLVNPDMNDFSKIELSGAVNTSDFVSADDIKKVLSAQFKGKEMPVKWSHDAQGKKHSFTIEGIKREKEEKILKITWDGKAAGIDEKGERSIDIPSTDSFKILSANVQREGEAYISIVFSDPLMSSQNFADFVQVKGYITRFTVDKNELKVYGTPAFSNELNLKVFQNIKNSAGLGLQKSSDYELRVSSFKPQVVIQSGKGVIMPTSNELILPIDVVGLKAIEVTVVRIFPNNIAQYLQENNMGGTYSLREVGRPVVKKIVPLIKAGITDYYNWSKISLDLKEIFDAEPGAIYQIGIGFNKEMAVYNCQGMDDNPNIEEQAFDSRTLDWDQDSYSYYGEYDWNQRDNPCHDMYYRRDKYVSKIVFASDIGLTAKRSENNKLHVLSTNIVSTEAEKSVKLSVYDYQNQLISEAQTDNSGMAELELYRKPFLLVAKKDRQFAYLKLQDGNALPLSNFDVSGSTAEGGLKGFIYGERGVWRPGDTLHLSFILEDTYQRVPADQKVVMELFTPQGQLFKSFLPVKKQGPIYSFKPLTMEESPTGNWLCKVRAGSTEFTKIIKIETIKPNRLKIELDFGKNMLRKSEGNFADLSVRWMHGAVAKNLKAEYEMFLSKTATKFKDFHNFNFDDPGKEFYTDSKIIFENRIDDKGNARFPIKIDSKGTPPGMLKAGFSGKVFEEGGDFSIHNTSILYSPYSSYVGVSVPSVESSASNRVLYTGKDNTIRIANVDEDGKKLANRSVTIEIYKLHWRWWWDHGQENISNYVSSSYNRPTQTLTVNLADGQTDWNWNIDNNDWGRYYLRVKDNNSGHSTGEVVYFRRSDWYGTMAKSMGGASLLNFSLSKEEAKTGETVEVKIPSSAMGHAYITLETGKEVIKKEYIALKDKETNYSFKLTDDMAPNVYVHVSLIQPHGQKTNDLPLRMYGVRNIMVENAATKLSPQIKAPANAQPGERVNLEISEKNKEAMAYTIALVDEGLLGLTNFKTPQAWDHFYAREALGIRTFDMFEDVLGSFTGKFGRLLSIGGDEQGPMEEKSESRFKPVVKYMGPFYLAKGATGKHSFTVPQYIGELRMMVVAAETSKYGAAETSISINQPLMLLATLPRVMGPGETTMMPITLFARDQSITNASVEINTIGKLKVKGDKKINVQLKPGGETIVYVEVEAEKALGAAKVEIKAVAGKNEAVYDVNMQIRASNPMMLSVADQLLEAGKEWTQDYKALGMPSTNQATLEISTLPPLNLEQRTSFLIRYPHGCVEQTTSAVFAQLYLPELVKLENDKRFEIQRNIEVAIDKLRNFQLSNGGFSYWPGLQEASEWGTNYAGHFLVAAQKKGYAVPNEIIQNFKTYQTRLANSWDGRITYRSDVIQAYRLYTLAMTGSPAMAAMNRMRENQNIAQLSKWLLANAYAEAGHASVGEELIANLSKEISDYRELSGTFGSSVRDQAMILETLTKLGRRADAFEMLTRIAKPLGNQDYWMSTQTTAYCLIAVAEYTKGFPSSGNLQAEINLGNQKINIDEKGYFAQVGIVNPDEAVQVRLKNNSGVPLYARLIRQGIPLEGGEMQENKNMNITISYFDRDGGKLDVSKISQGTDFKAVVSVSNPGTRGELKELALTQIFPSGWEILNTRLSDEAGVRDADKATYKDIRDDRVYTYFDLRAGEKKQFTVLLNASYMGTYYLPALQAEAMYDNSIYAGVIGQWVKVVE